MNYKTINNPHDGQLQLVIKDEVNGVILGTIDSQGRYQIWNPLTKAILRLGSLVVEGDSTNVASEGVVAYGANLHSDTISIDDYSYARIKNGRFGLYDAKSGGYTGYIFKFDTSEDEWYITDNSGNKNIKFIRSTGGITLSGQLQSSTAKIGDVTGGNYIEFKSDGIYLYGTCRKNNALWIDAGGIKAPGAKPATSVAHGLLETPAWSFSNEAVEANEQTVSYSIRIPERMDRSVAPTMAIAWSADAVSPGVGEFQFEYLWTAIGEDTGAAPQGTLYSHSTAPVTADGMVITSFTGLAVPSASDVCLHARIKRLSSASAGSQADTITIAIHLHGTCFYFLRNVLGTDY